MTGFSFKESRILELSVSGEATKTSVFIGNGTLQRAPQLLERYKQSHLVIVSDSNVEPLHAIPLRNLLTDQGFRTSLITILPGDEVKTLGALEQLYKQCRRLNLDRWDAIVAVGGGVTGDVAGMLAGTYLRGLHFIQVPTSLVAMVSASVGGKVGVNFDGFKNLIGMFKHPAVVLADPLTLETLPYTEFQSGLGELITIGVLGAPDIFESFERGLVNDLDSLITSAIRCKIEIVEADPEEKLGLRSRLNLGHTFGHAIEKLSNFSIAHGVAVAVGLHIASRLSAALGICEKSLPDRVHNALVSSGLPAALKGFHPKDVVEAMKGDKKRKAGQLRFILPVAIGEVVIYEEEKIPAGLLEKLLEEILSGN